MLKERQQWLNFFEQAGQLIQQLISAIGYPGIFLAALLETIFPPLPSELIMPFSGFQVARGDLTFLGAVVAGTLGAVVGAIPMYYIGRWADEYVIRRLIRRFGCYLGVSEYDLDRALRVFRKYGEAVVFFGRLIPLVRTLISIPAGMDRMPLPRFLLFTSVGAFIWTSALTSTGVLLGENWEDVLTIIERYEGVMIVVGVLALALLAVFLVVRHLRGRGQALDYRKFGAEAPTFRSGDEAPPMRVRAKVVSEPVDKYARGCIDAKPHLLPIIVLIVLISVAPAAYHMLKDAETRTRLFALARKPLVRLGVLD